MGKTKRGKGTKLMVLADGAGLALGVCVEAATPSEVKLLERALDSVKVRALLVKRDIEPIIPKRRNNRKATHQDGRKLRRYRRRWIIERTNSWLRNFRRLVARYERKVKNFEALVHLACALIALKRVSG